MKTLEEIKKDVIAGKQLTKEEAMEVSTFPIEALCAAANEVREYYCKNGFDLCTIINGKSGKCSENCKYCAQSAHYTTNVETYGLLTTEEIVKQAKYNAEKGILRYSIVTSGKRLSDNEVEQVCESIRAIKNEVEIEVCVSFGLLDVVNYRKIKEAGASRVHNNLETSEAFFPSVCTTHTFEEKIQALKAAREAGLSICSGGIIGLGETMQDRIDLAITLRDLGVKSVPVNILNPIPGTPFEYNETLSMEEIQRTIAIFRFLLPQASIRLAGGRGLLTDKGRSCFLGGANAAITGDMLTTTGITVDQDKEMLNELNYKVELWNE